MRCFRLLHIASPLSERLRLPRSIFIIGMPSQPCRFNTSLDVDFLSLFAS